MAVPDSTQAEVRRVLDLDLSAAGARDKHRDAVAALVDTLAAEIGAVQDAASGRAILASVWMDGAAYANMAQALTEHFRAAGWLGPEEAASALWAGATLAVCAHYRHMVGPAMLANADCHERLGDRQRAALLYDAVVKDFACLVTDWYAAGGAPNDDDRGAIECLRTALERSLALSPKDPDRDSWSDRLRRANDILARRDGD